MLRPYLERRHDERAGRLARTTALVEALGLATLVACAGASSAELPPKLRLGYFPTLTHAVAVAGVEHGFFARAVDGVGRLDTSTFNAGPEVVQALFSKSIDIAYVGPNPAINAHAQSRGEAIRVIAGAASGGASLVVTPEIAASRDLAGATLGSPQLGNTQDVALRWWLRVNGWSSTTTGGGAVAVRPQPNAQIYEGFREGRLDGAWVPEPWASRLVHEAGGRVLVDERDLWPDGRFATTLVVVRTAFLRNHPQLVRAFLRGHLEAIDYVRSDPHAPNAVEEALERITGARLRDDVLRSAWSSMTFTSDPIPPSLDEAATRARRLGFLKPVRIESAFALDMLAELLEETGAAA